MPILQFGGLRYFYLGDVIRTMEVKHNIGSIDLLGPCNGRVKVAVCAPVAKFHMLRVFIKRLMRYRLIVGARIDEILKHLVIDVFIADPGNAHALFFYPSSSLHGSNDTSNSGSRRASFLWLWFCPQRMAHHGQK